MPKRVKIFFSIVVILAAIAGYLFQAGIGQTGPSYAALAFGIIATISMWIFPEVSRRKPEHLASKK
jgi:hypothetical protein